MEQLRSLAFPDQSKDDVDARIQKWGGVPRHVLTHPEVSYQSQMLKNALTIDPRLFVRLATVDALSQEGVSNRVFVMDLQSDKDSALLPSDESFYQFVRMRICSTWIADRIYEQYLQFSLLEARHLATQFISRPELSVLGGKLVERLAIHDLAEGGTFLVRRLKQATPTNINSAKLKTLSTETFMLKVSLGQSSSIPDAFMLRLKPKELHQFRTLDDIKSSELGGNMHMIQVPHSANFSCVDAILPGPIPANVTLDPTGHGLQLSSSSPSTPGLVQIWEKLTQSPLQGCVVIPFLWVTTHDRFPEVKLPSRVSSHDRPPTQATPLTFVVDQFVLQLPPFTPLVKKIHNRDL